MSLPRAAVLTIIITMSAACERVVPSAPSSGGSIGTAAEISFCADLVNHYRATAGRPPLARSEALETFAAEAAQNDGLAHVAHHLFLMTNGRGTAMAETEILWWRGAAVRTVIQKGLEQMWQSGPAGEHYDIIVGPYSQIGCGIFVNGSEVTVAQDFR